MPRKSTQTRGLKERAFAEISLKIGFMPLGRGVSFCAASLALMLLAGCNGCGSGEKAKQGGTAPTAKETSFESVVKPAAETTFNATAVKATAVPTPVLKVLREQVLRLEPQSVGSANISILDTFSNAPAGTVSSARPGDYVLSNGKVSLFFASVRPRENDKPIEVALSYTNRRHPGALTDVLAGDTKVDIINEFTQGYGTDLQGPIVEYDSAEFVTRSGDEAKAASVDGSAVKGAAVGLRLTGSTASGPDQEIRIQTTYWLAPDETRVSVETKVLEGFAEAPIADVADFGPSIVIADIHGNMSSQPTELSVEWYAAQLGRLAMGVGVFGGAKFNGIFAGSQSRCCARKISEGSQTEFRDRWIFLGNGSYSSVTDQIFTQGQNDRPIGTFTGKVLDKVEKKPAPGTFVDLFWYDRAIGPADRRLFTRVNTDAEGAFSCVVPILNKEENVSRFFPGTGSRSRQSGLSQRSIVVKPGATVEREELLVGQPAILNIKVYDSKTSKPLAARVRFDAVHPAPNSVFGSIETPSGYANSFYVPREGTKVEMSQGVYTLNVSHGISYNITQADVQMAAGLETEAEIGLDMVSPTPGFIGVEVGAMPKATRGCSLSPEDVVLMCAGEGIQWIVSGDLETITDFAPAIAKMGCQDLLGASRGFRTILPKHPEWGEFLIYPVGPGALDPKQAREQWKDVDDAVQFIATLRKLYPGAMVEVVYPYADPLGHAIEPGGYFYVNKWNVYEMGFTDSKRPVPIEMNVDAVNLFAPRGGWQFEWDKDFLFINTLRKRFYIPVPVSNTRIPFVSEPGYPRLLVRVDQDEPAKVTEEALFQALRAGRWEVSSGPFLDLRADGRREGDKYQPAKKAFTKIKLTSPEWAATTNIMACLDGVMLWKETDSAGENEATPDRFKWEGQIEFNPEVKENADTLLNGAATSEATIDDIIPRPDPIRIPSIVVTGPIIADTNGNGEWDPPKYIDRAK
ncbi:hypothetical protein HY256_05525 [Candidatus Sumerlaeota bacterium]|nr:hypothetical protein [Candidatus Sumerlaeota bacterium]